MLKARKGFTLVEILVVVIIMAIVAAFGYPNYTRSQEKADERDGANTLSSIAAEMNMYRVRNNGFPPANMPNVAAINSTLNLGVVRNNVNYSCTSAVNNYTCTAISNYGWRLNIQPLDGGIAKCSLGTCPTCLPGGCPF